MFDFFEQQERANRATRRMVWLFAAGVLATLLLVNALLALVVSLAGLRLGSDETWGMHLIAAAVVLGLIGLGTWWRMAQLAAGALTFLRGDVAPARTTLTRSYSPEQVRESIRLPRAERPYFSPGFPLEAALRHATRVASFERALPLQAPALDPAADPIVSDTGELRWHRAGLVVVDTARTQSLIGFLKAVRAGTANLAAEVETDFCALTLVSLDGKPVRDSGRLLLTAGARAANTGMVWNARRTSLTDWGGEPTRIEPVSGRVLLRGLAAAKSVEARALGSGGQPLGAPAAAGRTPDGWSIPIGSPPTVWYTIAVAR